ncbi:MAG: lipocalin family protein, partial [Betaproteobacteria bacterium]
ARALPMPTAGELKGPVWFDHEWSSELLDPEAQGWDWVGLHLNDGSALMAFRIRRRTGEDLWRTANWVNTAQEPLLSATQAESIRFETLRSWRSPRTSASWPVAQRLYIGGRTLELQPLFDDQELQTQGSTGVTYWEGAVTVHEANRVIGRGYLELTGYAQAMRI